jgi:DNA mismatch repair protein MutS2
MAKIESEARADADAAVVQTLDSSQADLGIQAEVPGKPVPSETLSAGQQVVVKGWKQPLTFRRHDGRSAEVEAGLMRLKVPLADIIGFAVLPASSKMQAAIAGARTTGVTVHTETAAAAASEEINVIGCTVEEAVERVDKFLDDAALAAKPSVRIIHGHGTGALRRGLGKFLSTHPLVESIHAEAEDRGGTAITIAELKS